MKQYHKYSITESENFEPGNCPDVVNQIITLRDQLAELPQETKINIIISFLKDHCINTAWINKNPGVANKMVSGTLAISEIEKYFESCKTNKIFLKDFENFIREQFQKASM